MIPVETYKLKWIVPDLIISYIIFICPIILLAPNTTRIESFVIAAVSAIMAIGYMGIKSKLTFGFNFTGYLIIGFFVKLLIGYLFWEFYMFPDYFSNPNSGFVFDHYEYLLTHEWMKEMAEARIEDGIVNIPTYMWFYKNSFIHLFMSNLYMSGSFNPFDIAVQNALFSIFTAIIVAQIVKFLGGSIKQQRSALIIALFLPFSIISSIIFRDIVGQFFVALGGLLIVRSVEKKALVALSLIALASLAMFMQRYIYLVFPVAVISLYFLTDTKNRYKLLLIPFLFIGLASINSFFSLFDAVSTGYSEEVSGLKLYLLLPLNIIRLFIGPFPWINWFKFDDFTIFLIVEYLQAVLNITFAFFIVKLMIRKKSPNFIPQEKVLIMLFALFMFTALGTKEVHANYMSIGAIFLIPVLMKHYSLKRIGFTSIGIFFLFLLFNFLFIAMGLGGMGLGQTTR